jgi:hypothetical protein
MSKKSRRRNRRLLKALGAGLAIAGLGGAFKKNRKGSTDADTVKAMTSDAAYSMPKDDIEFKETIVTTPKVYQDSIMRGGVGVKAAQKPLRFGEVVTKSGERKTIKPFKSAGLKFGIGNGEGLTQTQKAVNRANKEMSQGKLPPQLRAPGRTNITTGQGKFRQDLKDFANFMFPKLNLKSGGRVKKRTGAAKRGFGRAFKGGK